MQTEKGEMILWVGPKTNEPSKILCLGALQERASYGTDLLKGRVQANITFKVSSSS